MCRGYVSNFLFIRLNLVYVTCVINLCYCNSYLVTPAEDNCVNEVMPAVCLRLDFCICDLEHNTIV
jgi:hypothetical protein